MLGAALVVTGLRDAVGFGGAVGVGDAADGDATVLLDGLEQIRASA
jgi:hypothetical protein